MVTPTGPAQTPTPHPSTPASRPLLEKLDLATDRGSAHVDPPSPRPTACASVLAVHTATCWTPDPAAPPADRPRRRDNPPSADEALPPDAAPVIPAP